MPYVFLLNVCDESGGERGIDKGQVPCDNTGQVGGIVTGSLFNRGILLRRPAAAFLLTPPEASRSRYVSRLPAHDTTPVQRMNTRPCVKIRRRWGQLSDHPKKPITGAYNNWAQGQRFKYIPSDNVHSRHGIAWWNTHWDNTLFLGNHCHPSATTLHVI